MTIKECYDAIGGSYDDVIKRLVRDQIVERFAVKFLKDGSYSQLEEALRAGDADEAFAAAHTLKGVSGNLCFTRLYGSVCEITELLRSSDLAPALAMLPRVKMDYDLIVNTLKNLTPTK